MQINFEKVGRRYRKLITKVYQAAEQVTGNEFQNAIVTVTFAKKDEIRNLNRIYRNVDRATDVLSFPMLDMKYTQKISDFLDEISPDGSLYVGDVVICKKIAKKQAKEYGHKKKREIAFLALHGLLHLYGFDHIEKKDEMVMTETANIILDGLELKRGNNV